MSFLTTFSGGVSKTYKEAVRTASSSLENVNLASAPAAIGGVTLNAKDRVLLTQQSIASENGIYVFSSVGAPLIRAADSNTSKEFVPGMLVPVAEGTYADKIFELATDGVVTLGTTALNFQLALLPINLTTDVIGVLPVANGGTNRSSWTQGRIVFADTSGTALTEDLGLNWDNSNKRLGVGTSTPAGKVQIVNSGSQVGLSVYSTSTNNTASLFNQGTTNYTLELNSASTSPYTGASIGGYFARGTLSSKGQTLSGDALLSLSASGHTGSAVAGISAAIVLAADENTSALSYGGQVVFATTPNGVASPLPLPRMVVKNDGNVGINTLTPSQKLHVSGNILGSNLISSTGVVQAVDTQTPSAATLTVRAGNAVASNTNGGDLNLQSGMPTGTGTSGYIYFSTGSTSMWVEPDGKIRLPLVTANRILSSNASSQITALSTATYPSLTELSYVKGVTSAIQTQLNAKVDSVSGSAPISSSGGTTPTISISQASGTTDGYLSAADWLYFDSKQPAGNYANDQLSNLNATTAINSSLLFGVDNSVDIGADGANRPAGIHAANHVTAPTIRGRDNVNGSGQHDITVRAGNGLTGNKNGGDLTLAGGLGVGSGVNGEIVVQVAGSEIARFEKESVLKLSGGLKVKSLHAQVGTLDIITIALNDYYIGVDCSSAAKRVDLPLAANAEAGKIYVVKDESGDATLNNISVYPSGTDKIDGLPQAEVLAVDNESITLVCNGVDGWFII